jgi:diacylglycerol O-acyltransferase / wax synthase
MLTGVDTAFLNLERKEIPLNIALVCVFERAIPFQKFVKDIESKLHLLPRYRQIVVVPPFHMGYPSWKNDPNFDIGRHIFRARLHSPGGDTELEALTGRIISPLMDRSKPLWDIHVIDGFGDGRGALIVRLHHALADGVSAASAILGVILDRAARVYPTMAPRSCRAPELPAHNNSVMGAITEAVHSTAGNLGSAMDGVLGVFSGLQTSAMRSGLKGVLSLLPQTIGAFERLPFNKRCTGKRKFCWAEFEIGKVQAIRDAAGGTVNDVVLAVLTRAIAQYAELHGQNVTRRHIRVVCPVNIRRDNREIGNRISLMPVVLPLDINHPVAMLKAVSKHVTIMKNARIANMVAAVGGCMGIAPPAVQAALWRTIPEFLLPVPLCHIVCTNVPGSSHALYSVGRRMIASYPQVPAGYDLGINCAVTSYCRKLFVGLSADDDVAPDVGRLRDFMQSAFEDLCGSLRIERGRGQMKIPKAKRVRDARRQTHVAGSAG